MTILDDAKDGMNLDIRPQDDLFGHVNGTWLETAEIPSDRSSWGPFVKLSDQSEERVREIIEDGAIPEDVTIPAGANGQDSYTFTSAANTVTTLSYGGSAQVPPPRKVYSLTDQIRRSSRSVCANLAEAWRKRRYRAAFISKLSDVEAEAAETQVWLQFAVRCGYLEREAGGALYQR